ncbi:hypothetical protein ERJ75_000376300 [Trypanosoma vivax]|nr:hypothetical protein ERJ75_000376300 [Trypanosoma vivax]
MRGARWNSEALSAARRVAMEKALHEAMVLFCLLQEARLVLAECSALKRCRGERADWGTILAREETGGGVGVLEKKIPERATVTLRLSAKVSLTIASAYFPRKAEVSSDSLGSFLEKQTIGGRS